MKTTVDIADSLLQQAKAAAHERGTTLRALIEEGLQRVLTSTPAKKFKLRDASVGGKTRVPGLRENDWRQMRAFAYGSHLGYPDDATRGIR